MATSTEKQFGKVQSALDTAAKLQDRAKKRTKEKAAAEPAQLQLPMMLPMLHADDRAMPNALARGAIFNATKTGENIKREFYENRVVASLSNFRIEYQGQELRQDDCSVFIALLYFQQDTVLGEPIFFTAYEMLRELGWTHNQREYKHLRDCCTRLSATNLSISFGDGSEGYAGSLLRNFAWKDESSKTMSKWCVRFEPGIARFFQEDRFSIIDPKIRRKISGRAPLAQWLHSFFSTHAEPIPISVAKYHELSQSTSQSAWDFKNRMKMALQKLKETGFLKEWEIRDELVYVKRVRFSHQRPIYRKIGEDLDSPLMECIE
jgi:hypothetical protein